MTRPCAPPAPCRHYVDVPGEGVLERCGHELNGSALCSHHGRPERCVWAQRERIAELKKQVEQGVTGVQAYRTWLQTSIGYWKERIEEVRAEGTLVTSFEISALRRDIDRFELALAHLEEYGLAEFLGEERA